MGETARPDVYTVPTGNLDNAKEPRKSVQLSGLFIRLPKLSV